MRNAAKFFLAAAVAFVAAGCASETFLPEAAPEFLVVHDRAPVYRLGPQQAAPPDARLAKGDRVRLLRREFGYSLALLTDGQTGYIANEDIEPAPPAADLLPAASPRTNPDLNTPPADAPAF